VVAAPEATTASSDRWGRATRAAVAAWRAQTDEPFRLSAHTAALIERYCAQLDAMAIPVDRGGRPDYGIWWLECAIADAFDPGLVGELGRKPWERGRPWDGGRPRSLASVVRLLRREARRQRRARRARG
jgi:hypothetical protein